MTASPRLTMHRGGWIWRWKARGRVEGGDSEGASARVPVSVPVRRLHEHIAPRPARVLVRRSLQCGGNLESCRCVPAGAPSEGPASPTSIRGAARYFHDQSP
jgi:hypothetical protein